MHAFIVLGKRAGRFFNSVNDRAEEILSDLIGFLTADQGGRAHTG